MDRIERMRRERARMRLTKAKMGNKPSPLDIPRILRNSMAISSKRSSNLEFPARRMRILHRAGILACRSSKDADKRSEKNKEKTMKRRDQLRQPMLNRLASPLEGIIENVKEKNSNTFLFILTASKLPH